MTKQQHSPPPPALEDPQLRRMLATHMHCGEPMQLAPPSSGPPEERPQEANDAGLLTYRCACGFSFDQIAG